MGIRKTLLTAFALLLTLVAPTGVFCAKEEFRTRISSVGGSDYTLEDVGAEVDFGREVAAQILGTFPLYENSKVDEYIGLVGTALAMNSPRTEVNYHFAILDTDVVNAFAAPGGFVFVTKGALELMEDEAELAALLAHEISHITNRHIIKEMNVRSSGNEMITGLSQVIGANTRTARALFKEMVDSSVNILFERGYKIEDEFEADKDSVTLLAAAGYDVNGLERLLKKIAAKDEGKKRSVGATHPPTAERENRLKGWKETLGVTSLQGKAGQERFSAGARPL
jgi:predicted Zn-dependent protease